MRILHELDQAGGQLAGDQLEQQCAAYKGHDDALPPGARTGTVKDPYPHGGTRDRHAGYVVELARLLEDELVGVEPDGAITITTAGAAYLAEPPPWPELADVDAALPLVYPPGATAAAAGDPGDVVVEGRTRGEQALSAIGQRPGITIPELAEILGVKQNYLYRVLPALEQDGKVIKRGRGWHPADDGLSGTVAHVREPS